MILAQIGMGQNEIAQALRIAQPCTMADHQPGMRPQHGDMIGRGLGVRGPDADIDQRDAVPVRPFQVIGRHLRQLRQGRDRAIGRGDFHIPGRDETGVALRRIGQHLPRDLLEFVDVELIVGEEHMVLEMLRACRGVMREPGERVIHPLRGEGRQMPGPIRVRLRRAIHDIVVHAFKRGHVEDIAQGNRQRAFLRDRHLGLTGDGEMHRDRRVRGADLHRHPMVAHQEPDLLRQVIAEEIRAGDRRHLGPGGRHMAEAQPAVGLEMRGDGDPHLGVEGAKAGVGAAGGQNLVELLQQKAGRLGVKLFQPGHRGGRVGECVMRRGRRGQDRHGIIHAKSSVSWNFVTSTRPRSEMRISGITTSARSECCI